MPALDAETLAEARELASLYPEPRSALIPICHLAQSRVGWLSPAAVEEVAALLSLEPAEVLGTASFYEMLRTEPVGRYMVSVCTNIACMLGGAYELLEHAETVLDTRAGSTSADGIFTLEEAECIADCDRAPCLQVNYRFFGDMTDDSFDALVRDLRDGRLAAEVPEHGTLCRERRRGGLAVPRAEVLAQRAEADEAAPRRAAGEGKPEASG